jgi:hypothetical protein
MTISVIDRKSRAHYEKEHPRQIELENMVVKLLIVELGLPLSIVDRSAFSRVTQMVDPHFAMPHRRTIARSTLSALDNQMVIDIKSRCSTSNYIAASLDCWTDRQMRAFFSVTAHTIKHGNFESCVGFLADGRIAY